MQNNKIRKAKFSHVCSANLELTTDDHSRRFYFNDQFQKAELFRRAYRTELAPTWQLSVNSLREHKYPYLLTWCSSVEERQSLTGGLMWPALDMQLMGNHLYG